MGINPAMAKDAVGQVAGAVGKVADVAGKAADTVGKVVGAVAGEGKGQSQGAPSDNKMLEQAAGIGKKLLESGVSAASKASTGVSKAPEAALSTAAQKTGSMSR